MEPNGTGSARESLEGVWREESEDVSRGSEGERSGISIPKIERSRVFCLMEMRKRKEEAHPKHRRREERASEQRPRKSLRRNPATSTLDNGGILKTMPALNFTDDLLSCALCYLFLVGIVYAAAFLVVCIVAVILQPRPVKNLLQRWMKPGIFMAILLFIGDVYGLIWGYVVLGRFYLSADYCGIDFLPFLPVIQMSRDPSFPNSPAGLIHGSTLSQIYLLWLIFALATWGTTIALYRWLRGMALS